MATGPLPLPPHHDPARAGEVWPVAHGERMAGGAAWAARHGIAPAADDERRTCLLLVDCQNTFCVPGFELFVGGPSGAGAVDDTVRICELVYRELGRITEIVPTLDTHRPAQIFHPVFWVDAEGRHPAGGRTVIGPDDLEDGRWRVNPAMAPALGRDLPSLERHARHYVATLAERGRDPLTIWPYHALLGSTGHALVSAIGETVAFHAGARRTVPRLVTKGDNPLTEHYSALAPEVLRDADGAPIGARDDALVEYLLGFDTVLIAGQAKSHCVAWTVEDLLADERLRDPSAAGRIRLLDDCSSPVVIPGAVDFSARAEAAYARFARAGVRVVRSTAEALPAA